MLKFLNWSIIAGAIIHGIVALFWGASILQTITIEVLAIVIIISRLQILANDN